MTLDKSENSKSPGVFIRTFGCQMNDYDSQKLLKILEPRYTPVSNPAEAELILINTCSVRDKPEQKLYSMVGELKAFKKENPGVMIGVGGCVAQQEGDRIVKRSPDVDFVFGTHNLSLVPSLIDRRREGLPPQVAVDYRDEWEDLPLGLSGEGRVSVFVSISRGCNKNCTYCIVPTTRGPEVSRPLDEILREVKIAVHRGAKEVVLLGQTVNSYGLDLSPRFSFVKLLEQVSEVPGLERIRFTSPHPQEVRKDFIDLVVSNPKICRHIHMPLQSGSDRILKAMNRNYRRDKYLGIIEALKTGAPDMAITTDVIVGFPGESEDDFRQTMEIMELVQFENSYSFIFSPRPGTKAALLADSDNHEIKLERLKILQAKQEEMTRVKLKSWVGKQAQVLIDGPSAHAKASLNGHGSVAGTESTYTLQGRISQSFVVNLDPGNHDLQPGALINADINGTGRFTLKANVLAGN